MAKVVFILKWVLAAAYVLALLALSFKDEQNHIINEVAITFENNEVGLLSQNDIKHFLSNNNIIGKTIDEIDLAVIENKFLDLSAVRKVEVYKNVNGKLSVNVLLREPIVRIITNDKKSFYLDKEGKLIEVTYNKAPRMIIVNGKITQRDLIDYRQNPHNDVNILTGIYKLAKLISKSEFWKAQIQQIYVTGNKELELIPTVGPQTIEFGFPSDTEKKMRNLKEVYQVGFKNIGWNKYKTINLRYKNQVVCTKR